MAHVPGDTPDASYFYHRRRRDALLAELQRLNQDIRMREREIRQYGAATLVARHPDARDLPGAWAIRAASEHGQ